MSQTLDHDDEMPAEIDFSRGQRGRFFKPGMTLNLPVYLDAPVQARLAALCRPASPRSPRPKAWSSPPLLMNC